MSEANFLIRVAPSKPAKLVPFQAGANTFENMFLVYVALQMPEEAQKAAVDYISRLGRLPWPERHALLKLNIHADALYVQSQGHTA